jgi:hypothetical protein
MTEDGRQMTENRRQKTDDRRQMTEKRIEGALLNYKLYPGLYALGPRPSKIRKIPHER